MKLEISNTLILALGAILYMLAYAGIVKLIIKIITT